MNSPMFFPLFVNLEDKEVYVIGAGKIATRRVNALIPFDVKINIVAPEATELIAEWHQSGKVAWEKRSYRQGELNHPYMVIVATDDIHLNNTIYEECKSKGIMVNVASDKDKSDFYFPGIVIEAPVVVGVCASGTDHKKAKEVTTAIRQTIKEQR